jgi:hypothetical protein
MYEDEDLWPIKCPECLDEFTEQIGRMKAGQQSRCPGCSLNLRHPKEEFALTLAEAKAGRLDPWGNMLRLQKPA